MSTIQFGPLDYSWLSGAMAKFGINAQNGVPPTAKLQNQPIELDLRGHDFCTLFDLVNLFLLVDCLQFFYGPVTLRFTGLRADDGILPLDAYNDLRRSISHNPSIRDSERYQDADKAYTFLAFLHHFGFFSALRNLRSDNRVVCAGLSDTVLEQLHAYSGVRNKVTRVLPLFPIRSPSDLVPFRSSHQVTEWLADLPESIRQAPVFSDGEFSRVFGYQLTQNIIEHSRNTGKAGLGAFGAIAMRVVPSERHRGLPAVSPIHSFMRFRRAVRAAF